MSVGMDIAARVGVIEDFVLGKSYNQDEDNNKRSFTFIQSKVDELALKFRLVGSEIADIDACDKLIDDLSPEFFRQKSSVTYLSQRVSELLSVRDEIEQHITGKQKCQ